MNVRSFVRVTKRYSLRNTTFSRWKSVNSSLSVEETRSTAGINDETSNDANRSKIRTNRLGIQLLSQGLYKQIFRDARAPGDETDFRKSMEHLRKHDLWGKPTSTLPDVEFELPTLLGENVDEHFRTIAIKQSETYKALLEKLAESNLPPIPNRWAYEAGWTKYNADGSSEKVRFPDEQALVFDIEVLMTEGPLPTMATAVSASSWYSWCSRGLVKHSSIREAPPENSCLEDLIPLESDSYETQSDSGDLKERIIVGHNVSFDRSRIKEQYRVSGTKTRFMDTMSLHIAISGMTGLQRALALSEKTGSKRKNVEEAKAKARGPPVKDWMNVSCLNNLADVYKLYCKGDIEKDLRETFVKGNVEDVRENFQNLMTYCAGDVIATHGILAVLSPLFFYRFPHPVTFAGMLEMSCAFLPVNENWEKYVRDAQSKYQEMEAELKDMLMRLANEACGLLHGERYKNDPWLWDLDWSLKKPTKSSEKARKTNGQTSDSKETVLHVPPRREDVILQTKRTYLANYPAWYRKLFPKFSEINDSRSNLQPGSISLQMQLTPKLLRLTWDGYPLAYTRKNGWGYLVPGKAQVSGLMEDYEEFPLKDVEKVCSYRRVANNQTVQSQTILDAIWERLAEEISDSAAVSVLFDQLSESNENDRNNKIKTPAFGNELCEDEQIPGCWFYRLPHKDGPSNRVGNPLAKDFLSKIEDGTLQSKAGEHADWALNTSKMISYWRNAHKRITSQMVVWLNEDQLPDTVTRSLEFDDIGGKYGAILPQIVTAGTVTRRAVEATWLTASNAYVRQQPPGGAVVLVTTADRVGSELKGMIQAFPGYHFVGADVDSQELWIAALLGDAHFARMHGCTAFGWMTLQGKKSDGTDMHSRTAATAGITRDQAKVMNYGRIYGAGQTFATRLLMQFNHRLRLEEAKSKAQTMYAVTKGIRGYVLNETGRTLLKEWKSLNKGRKFTKNSIKHSDQNEIDNDSKTYTRTDLIELLKYTSNGLEFSDIIAKSVWMGGTESAMFNKLESIANCPQPKTPTVDGRISRALEPAYVADNFMTSRINWVVQSSAVDFLHLIIHDEVRYLVASKDRYRAALALQITNLLTRAMFAYKLGFNDLPQSVAFFSSVDIDKVLRKEVHMDCVTPSNPYGLEKGYGIYKGEALDIHAILKKTKGTLKENSTNVQTEPE